MSDKLYIVIPAYNESENVRELINDWYLVVEKSGDMTDSRMIVIDDGSKDDTFEILQKLAETRPLLLPLTKPNGGHGPTLLYGYRYAIEHGADWIFQTDSDGQTDPAEFDRFWELRDSYDAIIGSRPDRQDGSSRKLVERVLCKMLRVIFGVNVPDSNAPFRLMRSSLVEKYIDKMPEDFNLPNVMLTTYFTYFGEAVRFIDVTFKPRQGGTNSINIKKIVKIGAKAVGDFRYLKSHIDD